MPPTKQNRAPGVPREARRLPCPPPKSGAPMFADSEPRRGPLDALAALGPRHTREGFGAK
eukprot:11762486-Alexandrium_andersonii.AAC.1